MQSTRFAAIATAVAVVLGGTAIALAVHANGPSSADLPGISTTRSHSTASPPSAVTSTETTPVVTAVDPQSPAPPTRPAPSTSPGSVRPPSGSIKTPDTEEVDDRRDEDEHEVVTPEIREDDHDSDEEVHPPESSSETHSAPDKDSD